MPAFLKQPWSIKRSTLCAIWENNLETFEKLFSMIQSGCSIYSHFLKSLHWNIHELWHKAPKVMKITIHSLRAINWTLDLPFVFLKFSRLLGCIFLNLFFISPNFLKRFSITGMIIYNTRNRSNDSTETQKEKKACFNDHAGGKWNLNVQCIVSTQIRCDH